MVATRNNTKRTVRIGADFVGELPLPGSDWVALDIETTGLNHLVDQPVLVSVWDANEKAAYVADVRVLDTERVHRWLVRLVADRGIIGHNLEFDLRFLRQSFGVEYPKRLYDTMIAERLLTAGKWKKPNGEHEWRTSLADVVDRRLGITLDKSLQTSFGSDGDFSEEQIDYAINDLTCLHALANQQNNELHEFGLRDVRDIEMACVPIFAEMTRVGVTLHREKHTALIQKTERERDILRDQIQAVLTPLLEWPRMQAEEAMQADLDAWNARYKAEEARLVEQWQYELHTALWPQDWLDETSDKNDNKPKGLKRFVRYGLSAKEGQFRDRYPRPPKPKRDTGPINIGSDKQMIEAFGQMGIELPDYRGKTLATVMLGLKDPEQQKLIQQILDYKKHQKLLDAFGESMAAMIAEDGRLHGNNNQIGTATGRPSGHHPNLFQMPRMRLYRECFIPAPGMLFVICDYSQMEMRIVAECSGDRTLADAFSSGLDIHTYTARLMFKVEEPTKDQRHTAKTINFGILYGMGPKKMRTELAAKGVFLTEQEAYAAVNTWKATYPDAYRWIQEQGQLAVTQGYTATPFGRRRFFDTEFATDQDKWGAARAGANHPIQGSNADATKLAMVLIHQHLKDYGGHIVLQIYDEIVVEIPREYATYAKRVVEQDMLLAGKQVLQTVPCEVDAVISTSWAEEDAVNL